MILVCGDPGSRWFGLLAFDTESRAVLRATTADVNPTELPTKDLHTIDVRPIAAGILAAAVEIGAECILLEHAPWFPRKGSDTGEQINSQRQWTLCDRIVTRIAEMAAERVPPLPVEIVHVNAARARVVPRRAKTEEPLTMDRRVALALPAYLSPESLAMVEHQPPGCPTATHQRDAAVLAIGWPYPPKAKAKREPRPVGQRAPRPNLTPSAQRNAGWLARRSAARAAARAAAGCQCPPKNHRKGCPLSTRPATYRKSAAARP